MVSSTGAGPSDAVNEESTNHLDSEMETEAAVLEPAEVLAVAPGADAGVQEAPANEVAFPGTQRNGAIDVSVTDEAGLPAVAQPVEPVPAVGEAATSSAADTSTTAECPEHVRALLDTAPLVISCEDESLWSIRGRLALPRQSALIELLVYLGAARLQAPEPLDPWPGVAVDTLLDEVWTPRARDPQNRESGQTWLRKSLKRLQEELATAALLLAAAEEERLLGQPLIEALVLALLLGVVVRNVARPLWVTVLNPGATLASKQILEVGVALLGATVSFPTLLAAGPALLVLVVGGVAGTLAIGFALGRLLALSVKLSVLVAVGNAICGNSAIAAVAPVIRADKKDVASSIALTAVIGVCLVLGLPLLIVPLTLDHYQYGVLAGMSVYAVPQVVAAAFPVSQISGEVATLVKLTRVLLLGPVVVLMGLLFRGERGAAKHGVSAYIPWFITGFLLLALVRSVGLLPPVIADSAATLSRLLTILAMAGRGFGVRLAGIRAVGRRVAIAIVGALSFITIFTVVVIRLLHIDG